MIFMEPRERLDILEATLGANLESKPESLLCFSSIYLSGKHFNIPGALGSGVYSPRFNSLLVRGSIRTREDLNFCQAAAFFKVSRWKTLSDLALMTK